MNDNRNDSLQHQVPLNPEAERVGSDVTVDGSFTGEELQALLNAAAAVLFVYAEKPPERQDVRQSLEALVSASLKLGQVWTVAQATFAADQPDLDIIRQNGEGPEPVRQNATPQEGYHGA